MPIPTLLLSTTLDCIQGAVQAELRCQDTIRIRCQLPVRSEDKVRRHAQTKTRRAQRTRCEDNREASTAAWHLTDRERV